KYTAISSPGHPRPLASLDQTPPAAVSSSLHVREAGTADAPKIAEAHVDSIRTLGILHYDEDVVEAWSAGGNLQESRYIRAMERGEVFFIALDPAGHVLGFSTHDPTIRGQHRTAVYVRGSAARQGVGTALFRTAEAHALAAGAREIRVDAALSAVEF